jgi:hypothetical protein
MGQDRKELARGTSTIPRICLILSESTKKKSRSLQEISLALESYFKIFLYLQYFLLNYNRHKARVFNAAENTNPSTIPRLLSPVSLILLLKIPPHKS